MKELLVLATLFSTPPAVVIPVPAPIPNNQTPVIIQPIPAPKPAPAPEPGLAIPCLPTGALEEVGARVFHELPVTSTYKVRTYLVEGKLLVVGASGPIECILDVVVPPRSFEGREG